MTSSTPNTQIPIPTQSPFLIIGYGNELWGDDAVGPEVAIAVAGWQLPSVKSIAVQHLMPELVADIVRADYVIFVDACGQRCALSIQLDPISMNKTALALCTEPLLAHDFEPPGLLALTHMLYGRHPQAWLLKIPTEHCDLGKPLSKTAQWGIDRALRLIEQFFRNYLRPLVWVKGLA
ncbi:MAG: hydrogenase maturation protease [Leptolyngbya sp. SIO1D8]|nr:hydrogenase maturation protease [Leptolyngbya sp. SIO1D8]